MAFSNRTGQVLFKSVFKVGIGGIGGAILAFSVLLGGNLWTYARLTHEAEVGTISFTQRQDSYLATISFPDQPTRQFDLKGDEWQLDTRILKWKPWATLLGKDTYYQLDRVSGRYRDPEQARNTLPSVADLRDAKWLDIWGLARDYPSLLFMVDAEYGSSVFLPILDGVSYRITMSDSGVLARRIEDNPTQ